MLQSYTEGNMTKPTFKEKFPSLEGKDAEAVKILFEEAKYSPRARYFGEDSIEANTIDKAIVERDYVKKSDLIKELKNPSPHIPEFEHVFIKKEKVREAIQKVEGRLIRESHGIDDSMWSSHMKEELGL